MMDIDIDYENMTEEQVDAILREHGYEPKLVGKYYRLVAEHEMLKETLRGIEDLAMKEHDKRMAITEQNSKLHKELRQIKKLVRALLDDLYEFGLPTGGRIIDTLETLARSTHE